MANFIMKLILSIVEIVVLLMWGIIGLFLWIPFLVRMIAWFMGIVIISMFDHVDMNDAQKKLNFAILFYANGFQKIVRSFHETSHEESFFPNSTLQMNFWKFFQKIAIDIVWFIIFWVLTFYMLSTIITLPTQFGIWKVGIYSKFHPPDKASISTKIDSAKIFGWFYSGVLISISISIIKKMGWGVMFFTICAIFCSMALWDNGIPPEKNNLVSFISIFIILFIPYIILGIILHYKKKKSGKILFEGFDFFWLRLGIIMTAIQAIWSGEMSFIGVMSVFIFIWFCLYMRTYEKNLW